MIICDFCGEARDCQQKEIDRKMRSGLGSHQKSGARCNTTRDVLLCPSNAASFVEGSTLRPDDDGTAEVYGRKLTAREIVLGGKIGIPEAGRYLIAVLQKNAPRNESKESARKYRLVG